MPTLNEILEPLSAVEAAKRLIGAELIREIGPHKLIGKIVETEAYDQSDPASHSYRGVTIRNQIMFASAGVAYVYFSYGMHYCFNVVAGREGLGEAVLIRALEPIVGIEKMKQNRNVVNDKTLLNGPGKLCQALKIDKSFNAHDLSVSPLRIVLHPPCEARQLTLTKRIGIRELPGSELNWRVCLSGNQYLSR